MGNKLTIVAAAGRAQLPPLDEPRRVEVDARALLVTPSPTEAEPPQLHFKCLPIPNSSEGCADNIVDVGGVQMNRFGFRIEVYLGNTCAASTKYKASQTNSASNIVKAGINLLTQAGGDFVAAVFNPTNVFSPFSGVIPHKVMLNTERPATDAGGACPSMCTGDLPCTSMYTLLENIASFSNSHSDDADYQKALSEALWSAVGEVSQYVAFSGETAPTMPASLLTAPTPAPASA